MLGQAIATTVIALLGLASAQDTTAPSVCAVGCVNGVFVNAANMGCANGDMLCVCGKTESFQDGIRDCIVAACAPDGPDAQIPLANAYANEQCAKAAAADAPPPTPTTSSTPPPLETTSVEAASSTLPAADSPTSTPVPSAESSPQSSTTSTSVVSTATTSTASSSVSDGKPTMTEAVSQSTLLSTPVSSSPTTSGSSSPAAASGTSPATTGLSTAVKAGIGAGVGAAALAAIIIAVCVCLRRRQRKKTGNRARNYKISEPMAGAGHQFGNDLSRADTGLPRPIITSQRERVDNTGMPTSPTSVYSNSSDLEAHARRYEDMPPRTQPRTMI